MSNALEAAIADLELQGQATKDALLAASVQTFDVTLTTADVNAGTSVIVPGVTGKSFLPMFAAFKCAGAASGATLLRLVEETSSGVVLSHVVADCTDGAWVGRTGGTPVSTLMDKPLVSGKDILADKTGSALATTTEVRYLVMGVYVDD
jgi:hypothetical protein